MRAFHFETFLKKVRSRADGECVLYTYWNDYTALAAALAAKTATGWFREYTEPIYISMRVTDTISPIKTRLQDE